MITPPQRLDLLRITGKQALTALVRYIYDVELDHSAVDIEVETDGNVKRVKLSGKSGSQYFAKTALSYQAIDPALSGIQDYPFILAMDLPVTVEKVRDLMRDKYGIVIDTVDLALTDSVVLATEYGKFDFPIHSSSLRFGEGVFNIEIIPKQGLDLAALIPPTVGQAITNVGFVALPPEDTHTLSEMVTVSDPDGFVGVSILPEDMVIPDE